MRYLMQPIDREQNRDPLTHSPTVSNEIHQLDYRIRETLFDKGAHGSEKVLWLVEQITHLLFYSSRVVAMAGALSKRHSICSHIPDSHVRLSSVS